MDSIKILAADINNLTDARYFAAWGIEWLSFYISKEELNEAGTQKYTEIKDWLEGPKFAARFAKEIDPESMMEFAAAVGLDGVISDALKAELLNSFPTNIQILLESDSVTELLDAAYETLIFKVDSAEKLAEIPFKDLEDYEMYLDIDFSPDMVKQHKHIWRSAGIVLRGGEEEKVGFKSFDELDEIFETLEVALD
jgi:phosphoribosylanthranilate isomerase